MYNLDYTSSDVDCQPACFMLVGALARLCAGVPIFAEELSTALMGKKKQTLSVLGKSLRFPFGVISQPHYGAGVHNGFDFTGRNA